jgi:hypothetical protein
MQYQWITAPFAIISLIMLVIALFFLLRKDWIIGWIKGCLGFMFLAIAIFMGLTALNVNAYRPVDKEITVATISFDKADNQLYNANVVISSSGSEIPFEIAGDLWQIDARVIKWKGLLATLGGKPGYKLDRIQGRYFTLEDERSKPRSVYALSNPDVGFDLWSTIDKLSNHINWFDAEYGSATFLPMADGALFTIQLTSNGLIARPENDRAIIAIKEWE